MADGDGTGAAAGEKRTKRRKRAAGGKGTGATSGGVADDDMGFFHPEDEILAKVSLQVGPVRQLSRSLPSLSSSVRLAFARLPLPESARCRRGLRDALVWPIDRCAEGEVERCRQGDGDCLCCRCIRAACRVCSYANISWSML